MPIGSKWKISNEPLENRAAQEHNGPLRKFAQLKLFPVCGHSSKNASGYKVVFACAGFRPEERGFKYGEDASPSKPLELGVASFGVSGVVARLLSPRLKAVSGQLAFTLATLRALAVYRDQIVKLEFDGLPARSMAITNCAIGNGRYFGAGMQVAPGAQLDDGEFDATIWSGFGVLDFIRLRGAIRDGSHVSEPGTSVLRTRCAIATSESTVLVEIDGESVGRLPARFQVLPAAMRLKV